VLTVDGVDVLDVREAAEYVGRTPETVRRWVWSGKVSAIRQGHRLLIPRSDLDSSVIERDEVRLSLRDWAATVPRAATASASSASDLVLEDRSDDDGR
jgi:excisionase family DNA binding protein